MSSTANQGESPRLTLNTPKVIEVRRAFLVWTIWSIIKGTSTAWSLAAHPELNDAAGYAWAYRYLDQSGWAVVWCGIVALFIGSVVHRSDDLMRLALVAQAIPHIVFGVSILGVTIGGSISTSTIGPFQWWTTVVVDCVLLWVGARAPVVRK